MMYTRYSLFSYFLVLFSCLSLAQETVTAPTGKNSVNDIVTAFYNGYGSLWIGTEKKGVHTLDKKTKKVVAIKGNSTLSNKKIQCLSDDGEYIWIGTDKGLYKYNRITHTCIHVTHDTKSDKCENIHAFHYDNNRLFIGSSRGILAYDTDKNSWDTSFKKLDTVQQPIHSLATDRHFIWYGTDNGIYQFNVRSKAVTHFTKNSGLPDNKITCSYNDNRNLWFGTRSGLCQYNILLDSWTTHTIADGLIDNMITAVEGDGRYLWVGTFMGLSRYDIESQTWQNYEDHKELSATAVNALSVDGDLLWIGADISGILKMEKHIPQCKITGIQSDNNILYVVGTIADKDNQLFTLEYGPNIFPFIGFRKGIEIFELKSAFYDTLASWDLDKVTDGDYLIRLQVIDNKGNSNEDLYPLFVDMKPPQITFDSLAEFVSQKKLAVEGSFFGHNIQRITFEPGNVSAHIDNAKQKFNGTVLLTPGGNTVTASIRDVKGRVKTIQKVVVFDNTPPDISLKQVTDHTTANTILLNGTLSDDYPQTIEIEPGNITIKCIQKKTSFSQNIPLKEGANRLSIKGFDKAGNVKTYTRTIYLDTIPPTFSVIPPEKFVNKPQLILSGTYVDDYISTIKRIPQLTDALIDTSNLSFTMKIILHEGTNIITLKCTDKARNETMTSLDINADFTPPRLNFLDFSNNTDKQLATLQGTYVEENMKNITAYPAQVHAIINESFHSYKIAIPLTLGENSIKITAEDLAGNSSEYSYAIIRKQSADTSVILLSKEELLKSQETISQLSMQVEQLQKELAQKQPKSSAAADNSSIASMKREIYKLKKENETLREEINTSSPSPKPSTQNTEESNAVDSLERKITSLEEENSRLRESINSQKAESAPLVESTQPSAKQETTTKYVSVKAAILRENPNINSKDIGRVYKNSQVTVMKEFKYWTKITTEKGFIGYIRNTLLRNDEIEE